MFANFLQSISTFPNFVLYLSIATGLSVLFAYVYTWATPHDEFALMRAGNRSATVSFLGTMLGAALPLSALIRVSTNILDLVLWGVVVLAVQYIVYRAVMMFLGRPPVSDEDTELSRNDALISAGTSVVIGLFSMACFH